MMLAFDVEAVPAVDTADKRIVTMAAKRDVDPVVFCSLCPPLAKVVAICAVNVDTDKTRSWILGVTGDEADVLAQFNEVVDKYQALLTFAGRSYDIPLLIHRSKIHGIKPASILLKAAEQKPWEDRPHVDLLNVLTFGRAMGAYSLQAFCIAYGVEDPKGGIDGSQVADLVTEGKLDELEAYCFGDVHATVELWKRWKGEK